MLTSLTLDDSAGNAVTLHETSNRAVSKATGLVGVGALRASRRPRPQGHGGLDGTRFEDGRLVTVEGAVWSQVSQDAAFTELAAITKPMVQTLDVAPALLKWREGATAMVTNLVTNPSTETNTSGYEAFGSFLVGTSTLTRETPTVTPPSGAYALKVVTAATSDQGVRFNSVALTAGQTYAVRVRVQRDAGGAALTIRLASGANELAVAVGASPSASEFTEYTTVVTAGLTATYVLYVRTDTAVATTFRVDALSVVQAASATTYFDGDTAGCEWTGTPHASTSVRNPGKQRLVRLASDVDPPLEEGAAMLRYQAQFYAEDPRAYSQQLATSASTGLVDAAGGLIFKEPFPWVFNPSSGAEARVRNSGSRPTPPVLRIYGYCTAPTIRLLTTGEEIVLTGEIANGDYLEIDVANHTVKLNGATSRRNLLNAAATTWWEIPTGTHTVQLLASNFDATARVDVISRSAY